MEDIISGLKRVKNTDQSSITGQGKRCKANILVYLKNMEWAEFAKLMAKVNYKL